MSDIFISYANSDRKRVEPIAKALEKQGWSVWWDRNIPVGKTWDEVIEGAIESSRCVIVIWSSASVKSGWVRAEAEEGLDRKILVPVLIENVRVPLRFRAIQAGRLIDWNGESDTPEFEDLLRAISWIAGSPDLSAESKPNDDEDRLPDTEEEKEDLLTSFSNRLGMKFELMRAGNFMMGSKFSPKEAAQKYGGDLEYYQMEHPRHHVEISKPFYIQATLVTQGQWENVMGDNPSKNQDGGEDCPVEYVSWDDVQTFIKKLNNIDMIYTYRLPTEAEWEYACRAGRNSEFSFGDDPDKLDEYAWYYDNSHNRTHPVAQKKPNDWGLYDMHGNVFELCQGWFGDYPARPVTDPIGPSEGTHRVLRGGSLRDERQFMRCAARYPDLATYRAYYSGFRLVAHGKYF